MGYGAANAWSEAGSQISGFGRAVMAMVENKEARRREQQRYDDETSYRNERNAVLDARADAVGSRDQERVDLTRSGQEWNQDFQQTRAGVGDTQWERAFDEGVSRAAAADTDRDRNYNLAERRETRQSDDALHSRNLDMVRIDQGYDELEIDRQKLNARPSDRFIKTNFKPNSYGMLPDFDSLVEGGRQMDDYFGFGEDAGPSIPPEARAHLKAKGWDDARIDAEGPALWEDFNRHPARRPKAPL